MIEDAAKAVYEEWQRFFNVGPNLVPWEQLSEDTRYLWARIAQAGIDVAWRSRKER